MDALFVEKKKGKLKMKKFVNFIHVWLEKTNMTPTGIIPNHVG